MANVRVGQRVVRCTIRAILRITLIEVVSVIQSRLAGAVVALAPCQLRMIAKNAVFKRSFHQA